MQSRHSTRHAHFEAKPSSRFEWWFQRTSISLPVGGPTNFMTRELVRRSRLMSIIVLFLLLIVTLILPATFFIPNHWTRVFLAMVEAVCVLTLCLNRAGKVSLAGIIIVIMVELVMMFIILTTVPFDILNLPLFDIFIVMELLAVSLLPAKSVFILAGWNTIFISLALKFQPHTTALTTALTSQFYNAWVRPAALQIIVAGVSYLWVRSCTQAILRADNAERIARLEHEVAEKTRFIEEERLKLEYGIQQLVIWHTAAAQGQNIGTPIIEVPIFWPLITAIKTTMARLHRSTSAERELAILLQAISTSTLRLDEVSYSSIKLPRTSTSLDQLLLALSRQNGRITQKE